MKTIRELVIIILLVISFNANAKEFIFKSKAGNRILVLNDTQRTVHYKDKIFTVSEAKGDNKQMKIYCNAGNDKRLFESYAGSYSIYMIEYQYVNVEEDVRLFHREGFGDYNINDIISAYASRINSEISNLDFSDKDYQIILSYTDKMIQGIKSGTIKGQTLDGSFITSDRSLSSSGVNKKGIFGYKKNADFYKNTAWFIMAEILKQTPSYIPQKKWVQVQKWEIERIDVE